MKSRSYNVVAGIAMVVVLGLFAGAARGITVDIDLIVNNVTNTWELQARVPQDGNAGIAGFVVKLTNIDTAICLAPTVDFLIDRDLGFTIGRDPLNAGGYTELFAAQLSIYPETLLYGVGQYAVRLEKVIL